MVSTGPVVNYTKLNQCLSFAINELKRLKIKTEFGRKSDKDIAEYILNGKYEMAKITVEKIIREDNIVEAIELVEMYCKLLLARIGLIQQMETLDDSLSEAVSSIIWVTPRLQSDVKELKQIAELLTNKYGEPYAEACRGNHSNSVSEKLMTKMEDKTPSKLLVDNYLIGIAKSQNISYEPDVDVLYERDDGNHTHGFRPSPPSDGKGDDYSETYPKDRNRRNRRRRESGFRSNIMASLLSCCGPQFNINIGG